MKICNKSSISWSNGFDLEKKFKALSALQEEFLKPDFWKNPKEAGEKQKKASQLKEEIDSFEALKAELESTQNLKELSVKIEEKSLLVFLSGEYDKKDAILSIQAGAGGRDAEDWVCLLLKMYQKYAESKSWRHKILFQTFGEAGGPEGRIGIKEVGIEIKGKFVFGFLKKENGAHRLVRLSPFSNKQLRQTSFAKVEVIPKIEDDEITESILKPDDLKIETFRSSGAGGQNVNRRETAVRATHLPTGLVANCQTERYQAVNKKIALEILAGKVLQLKEREKEIYLAGLKDEKVSADFGHQIRSYILHPYNLVKDHRTEIETTNTQAVLGGDLEKFIYAEVSKLNKNL
ncbi:MAG: PCRF domain-containing protein [bacterium]|nr:PCRF domain-containing protein [bacterium]